MPYFIKCLRKELCRKQWGFGFADMSLIPQRAPWCRRSDKCSENRWTSKWPVLYLSANQPFIVGGSRKWRAKATGVQCPRKPSTSMEEPSVATWRSISSRTRKSSRSGCSRRLNQNSYSACYIVEGTAVDLVGIRKGHGVPPREVFIKMDTTVGTVATVEVSSLGVNATPSRRSCSELGWPPRQSRGRNRPAGKRYDMIRYKVVILVENIPLCFSIILKWNKICTSSKTTLLFIK